MRDFIPDSITYSVVNKCSWSVYKRDYGIDNRNDVLRPWSIVDGIQIISYEPEPASRQAAAIEVTLTGLKETEILIEVFVKKLTYDFPKPYEYALKMISLTEPRGTSLPVTNKYYQILEPQTPYSLGKEQYLYCIVEG